MGKQSDYLLLRKGVWHYQRRVPADVADLDSRRFVRLSTGQHDKQAAAVVAARLNAEAEAHWRLRSATARQMRPIASYPRRNSRAGWGSRIARRWSWEAARCWIF